MTVHMTVLSILLCSEKDNFKGRIRELESSGGIRDANAKIDLFVKANRVSYIGDSIPTDDEDWQHES